MRFQLSNASILIRKMGIQVSQSAELLTTTSLEVIMLAMICLETEVEIYSLRTKGCLESLMNDDENSW